MTRFFLSFVLLFQFFTCISQEVDTFRISAYADVYWKYDFSGKENIKTYFANDHNSISLGMIGVGLLKSLGKASFVGELGFGPRGQYLSIPNGDAIENDLNNSFHIQNLFIKYAFTDKFSMTAGYMGTFVGYEVICPATNFHYSTSYLFAAGPFQNAGIKANYVFSKHISAMLGLFNDWNVYRDLNGVSHIGAQIAVTPTEDWNATLNFLTGSSDRGPNNYSSGTLIDLVSSYHISDKLNLVVNAANYNFKEGGGYAGVAVYPKYDLNEAIAVGLRAELFHTKDHADFRGSTINSFTLSSQFKHKGLILIPELRLDHDDQPTFLEKDGLSPSNQAAQASIALVYSF
ncbi:outer membrane beta-barrel protein [Sphingobacterium cellulitidis]|uniref:outer membrane beta-barrel protein n=1 Tax=Sphingobacterium cellulitidis TaxID=1768011 RepID=UPI003C7DCF93